MIEITQLYNPTKKLSGLNAFIIDLASNATRGQGQKGKYDTGVFS